MKDDFEITVLYLSLLIHREFDNLDLIVTKDLLLFSNDLMGELSITGLEAIKEYFHSNFSQFDTSNTSLVHDLVSVEDRYAIWTCFQMYNPFLKTIESTRGFLHLLSIKSSQIQTIKLTSHTLPFSLHKHNVFEDLKKKSFFSLYYE